jgi:Ca2+-transporting ATPase
MRDDIRKPFVNEITRNVWIWLAIATCILLLIAAVYVPLLSEVLEITHPGSKGWLLIIGMSVVPIIVAPAVRQVAKTHR